MCPIEWTVKLRRRKRRSGNPTKRTSFYFPFGLDWDWHCGGTIFVGTFSDVQREIIQWSQQPPNNILLLLTFHIQNTVCQDPMNLDLRGQQSILEVGSLSLEVHFCCYEKHRVGWHVLGWGKMKTVFDFRNCHDHVVNLKMLWCNCCNVYSSLTPSGQKNMLFTIDF